MWNEQNNEWRNFIVWLLIFLFIIYFWINYNITKSDKQDEYLLWYFKYQCYDYMKSESFRNEVRYDINNRWETIIIIPERLFNEIDLCLDNTWREVNELQWKREWPWPFY